MTLIDARGCTLVMVDYQQRLLPAIDRAAQVLAQARLLAEVARELGIRIVGTEQNPHGLGANDEALKRRCDLTLHKTRFDACADGLLEHLTPVAHAPVRDVVIAGCETHVCLMQTALGLMQAGLTVWVAAPACGSRSALDRELALQRLRQAGAGIVSVEMVAFEWLRSCEHTHFKRVLAMLKAAPP